MHTGITVDRLKQEISIEPYKYSIYRIGTKKRVRHRNMLKQKLCGTILALCGLLPMLIEKDATAFIFLAIIFLPMIFGKQYSMTFKEYSTKIKT